MGNVLIPRYGCLRRTRLSVALRNAWMVDSDVDRDLGEAVYMGDRDQLRCQRPKCVCDKAYEFQIGEKQVISFRNHRVARKGNVDIAEVRMEVGDSAQSGFALVRISKERYGTELEEYLI